MAGFSLMPWTVIFEEAIVVGALANSQRTIRRLPPNNCGVTLGVHVTAFAGGSITPKFRFGFTEADATTSVRGFDLRLLGALDASDFGALPVTLNAAVAPNVVGHSRIMVPPHVSVLFDSVVGTNLTYSVFAACWFMP